MRASLYLYHFSSIFAQLGCKLAHYILKKQRYTRGIGLFTASVLWDTAKGSALFKAECRGAETGPLQACVLEFLFVLRSCYSSCYFSFLEKAGHCDA